MKIIVIKIINKIISELKKSNEKNLAAEQEAWFFLEHITQLSKAQLIQKQEIELSMAQLRWLKKNVTLRVIQHKPLQYIIGNVPFCNLLIKVRPPILIPRPETEELCLYLIQLLKKYKIATFTLLDLCTGTGCIALSLAQEFPQAKIVASDVNKEALLLAEENKKQHNLNNVTFIHSNGFENIRGTFNIILSNPPYLSLQEWEKIEPSVKDWEDKKALVARDEGLYFYKMIAQKSKQYLDNTLSIYPIPKIIVEIGEVQSDKVITIFKNEGFNPTIIQDASHKNRFIACF